MSEEIYGRDPVEAGTAESLATPVQFEQPEVPEGENYILGNPALEDEILQGSEEDRLIGKEETALEMTPTQIQAMQTSAMLKIAESLQGFMQNQERTKQKSYSEILPDSPFNPTGKKNRTRLRGQLFQHGIPVNPLMMTEEEIEIANQLKPGRYVNRSVEVTRMHDGSVNITWPNKRIDQRLEFQSRFPTFVALCQTIVKERLQKEDNRKRGVFESEEIL